MTKHSSVQPESGNTDQQDDFLVNLMGKQAIDDLNKKHPKANGDFATPFDKRYKFGPLERAKGGLKEVLRMKLSHINLTQDTEEEKPENEEMH